MMAVLVKFHSLQYMEKLIVGFSFMYILAHKNKENILSSIRNRKTTVCILVNDTIEDKCKSIMHAICCSVTLILLLVQKKHEK